MARAALSRPVEKRLSRFRIAYHDVGRNIAARIAAGDRETVEEADDIGHLLRGEIEFRHSEIPASVQHDYGYCLAILVSEHELRPQQIRATFSAARIRTMAKAAIRAKELLPAGNGCGVRLCVRRILRRASASRASSSGGGCLSALLHS